MSRSHFKCKRSINTLRYLYRELELLEDTVDFITPSFLQYYHDFCKIHNINPEHGPPGTELPPENADELPQPSLSGSLMCEDDEAPTEYYSDGYGGWEAQESDSELSDIDKVFAKLFKNLAFHLHPDRIPPDVGERQREERIRMFKKALDALENKHYFRLVTMAEKFDIETPELNDKQLTWLKKEIKMVNQKIGTIQGSYNYHFSECESDDQKDNLMKSFIMQNFNIEV
jgi:hypothetical protein